MRSECGRGKNVKKNLISEIGGMSLVGLLVIPLLVTTQEGWAQVSSKHHAHYKVIDTGSFGGPNSHMSINFRIIQARRIYQGDWRSRESFSPRSRP